MSDQEKVEEVVVEETTDGGDATPTPYDDLLNLNAGNEEKVSALEGQLMAVESELSKLKAARFDMLMATASEPEAETEAEEIESDPDNPQSTDDLFEDED